MFLLESILTFFTLVHKAYVVVPLPFWHLLDTYIYFGNRNKNILKFLELRWEKKCQVVLHYLSTSHHQGSEQELNSNVKQISRMNFSHYKVTNFEKKLAFIENNLIIARMVRCYGI
jgi:hypothetical protein